jgi:hypothetical protein
MAKHFHYDSRDHHLPFNRAKRFAIFMTVLFALSLALNFAYIYFTDWSHAEDTSSNQLYLILAILLGFLALVGVVAVVTRLLRKQGYTNYQYLTLEGQQLSWQFNALKGPQALDLSQVDHALSDPRHLIFKTENEEVWLENYLIIDEGEWEKFLAALRGVITVK